MRWTRLPETPNAPGYGGAFVGTSGDTLLCGGGSNYPDKAGWEGGARVWHDAVYALASTRSKKWAVAGKLPRPCGYGVGVSIRQGLLMIGGADSYRHYADCYTVAIEEDELKVRPFPFLPRPLAYAAGALVGSKVIVAGGTERPDATAASSSAFAIDLANLNAGWKELPLCAGSGRMLAQAAGTKDTFYLFGGVALSPGAKGVEREFLTDCHAFTLGKEWRRLAMLPRPVAGAPSPCPVFDDEILLLGGDDGKLAGKVEAAKHPGYAKRVLAYDRTADAWKEAGDGSAQVLSTGCAKWSGGYALTNGELRPFVRTAEGWLLRPE
jgi:N-acetylneuraminate epimerase